MVENSFLPAVSVIWSSIVKFSSEIGLNSVYFIKIFSPIVGEMSGLNWFSYKSVKK